MRGKEPSRSTEAQNHKIITSTVRSAYECLDDIRQRMPPDLFARLIGVYVSETDERRQAVYDAIMKYAAMDGVTLTATKEKTDVK